MVKILCKGRAETSICCVYAIKYTKINDKFRRKKCPLNMHNVHFLSARQLSSIYLSGLFGYLFTILSYAFFLDNE